MAGSHTSGGTLRSGRVGTSRGGSRLGSPRTGVGVGRSDQAGVPPSSPLSQPVAPRPPTPVGQPPGIQAPDKPLG
jgi:hypothetical protein